MKIIQKVKDYIAEKRIEHARISREKRVLEACGCIVWCPHCRDILNDQPPIPEVSYIENNDGTTTQVCDVCGTQTIWDYGAPAPILLKTIKPDEVTLTNSSDTVLSV